jgi:O-antigen/teichoic acid export membrane protein
MLGFLALSRNIVDKMRIIPYSVGAVISPSITASKKNRTSIYSDSAHFCFILMVLISLILLMLVVPLLPYIYGNSYSPARGPLAFFILTLIPIGVQRVSSVYVLSCGNPGIVIRTGFKSACILVVLDLILIPFLGIYGAAIAAMVSITFDMIFLLRFIMSHDKVRIKEIFSPSHRDYKIMASLIRKALGKQEKVVNPAEVSSPS